MNYFMKDMNLEEKNIFVKNLYNMIKDTDKKMQELKSIFEKFEDINGKEYSYNLDDIYEFCFSRHINKE